MGPEKVRGGDKSCGMLFQQPRWEGDDKVFKTEFGKGMNSMRSRKSRGIQSARPDPLGGHGVRKELRMQKNGGT